MLLPIGASAPALANFCLVPYFLLSLGSAYVVPRPQSPRSKPQATRNLLKTLEGTIGAATVTL